MKQSNQLYLPILNEPTSFKEFMKKSIVGEKLIAHCELTTKKTLKEVVQTNTNCTILIGPEGDFSLKEIEIALENNYNPVSLGATRLRTETAAMVACHTIALINE
jgi:16S rRNA (uracil1498-N3)-methyltransferase